MTQSDDITNTKGMPAEMQSRMQEIISKHAEGYRRDLPHLVLQIKGHVQDLEIGRNEAEAAAALEREAHDMKGQAATFGLPEIASVAQSLCGLIGDSKVPDTETLKELQAQALKLEGLISDACK